MKPDRYNRIRRLTALLLLLVLLLSFCPARAEGGCVVSGTAEDSSGKPYTYVSVSGLTPYVFMPTGAGTADHDDFTSVLDMVERYGEENRILCAINAGIFYCAEPGGQYGFHYREADGPVICNGTVLKSAESIDHTECALFVVDECGEVGYAPFNADADALAAGTGTWFDVYGREMSGRRIVSAVTGFVPILIGGQVQFDEKDRKLHGYMNYVGHYTERAGRQVFGVKGDGSFLLLSCGSADGAGWTLRQAAEAALEAGCVFAYNLDGGGSVQTVVAKEGSRYTAEAVFGKGHEARTLPTYIVFTADDRCPVSAEPDRLEVRQTMRVTEKDTPESAAKKLAVTAYYKNADGNVSRRKIISALTVDHAKKLRLTLLGGAAEIDRCSRKRVSEVPMGVPVAKKTKDETSTCLQANRNTRSGGRYYDFSTGFTIEEAPGGLMVLYGGMASFIKTGELALEDYAVEKAPDPVEEFLLGCFFGSEG